VNKQLNLYFSYILGYIAGSPRFGVAPKVIIAGLTGYFVGKFSYQQKCVDKIMQLPNSPLGEMLRKQRAQRSGGAFAGFSETYETQQYEHLMTSQSPTNLIFSSSISA